MRDNPAKNSLGDRAEEIVANPPISKGPWIEEWTRKIRKLVCPKINPLYINNKNKIIIFIYFS
jgi:hypothetical protein